MIKINFSKFLKDIYKIKNNVYTKQEDFMKNLFKSGNPNFAYSDEQYKKLLNGTRPLNKNIREYVKEKFDYGNLTIFFKSILHEKKYLELLNDINVDPRLKRESSILAEALTEQFKDFILFGENNTPSTLKNKYEVLVDQHGNGAIENANEEALFLALLFFYQAINSINTIIVDKDILSLQAPFENFFNFIFKAFRTFENHCNLLGIKIFDSVKSDILNDNEIIDYYLNRITTTGAQPIDLVKKIDFIVYDNYFFQDKVLNLSIRLFEKNEKEKILDKFKKMKFYPVNEIFFTEKISFSIDDNNSNLIDDIYSICDKVNKIFKGIMLQLDSNYESLKEIGPEINKSLNSLLSHSIQYVSDGTYFPGTDSIIYGDSHKLFITTKKGDNIDAGNVKIKMSKHPILKEVSGISNKIINLIRFQHFMWRRCGHKDMMAELYTFNNDNSFKLKLVPVTSKARIYRLIREVTNEVFEDKIVGFTLTNLVTYNSFKTEEEKIRLIKMTSEERINSGDDYFVGTGYYNNNIYSFNISKQDSIKNKNLEIDKSDKKYLLPLINKIKDFMNSDSNK